MDANSTVVKAFHTEHSHGHSHGAASAECLVATETAEAFSVPLHVMALFVIMIVSAIGVFSPLLTRFFSRKWFLSGSGLDLLRHFGAGVILATGFIHMLPGGIAALGHPCLESFGQVYGSWATLFCMLGALGMQAIEFVAGEVSRRRVLVQSRAQNELANNANGTAVLSTNSSGATECSDVPQVSAGQRCDQMHEQECHEVAVDVPDSTIDCNVAKTTGLPVHHHTGHHCHTDPALLFTGATTSAQKIGTYILEFGIATHSVLIGLALGVSPNDELIALMIALIFHQFFEGIALGARIAEIMTPDTRIRSLFMAGIFALTTPLGTAIGLGVRTRFSETDPATLLTIGILDSISAGILIYTAFVHLIAAEVTNNERFWAMKTRRKVAGFAALWLGAGAMALIGKWA